MSKNGTTSALVHPGPLTRPADTLSPLGRRKVPTMRPLSSRGRPLPPSLPEFQRACCMGESGAPQRARRARRKSRRGDKPIPSSELRDSLRPSRSSWLKSCFCCNGALILRSGRSFRQRLDRDVQVSVGGLLNFAPLADSSVPIVPSCGSLDQPHLPAEKTSELKPTHRRERKNPRENIVTLENKPLPVSTPLGRGEERSGCCSGLHRPLTRPSGTLSPAGRGEERSGCCSGLHRPLTRPAGTLSLLGRGKALGLGTV